MDYHDELVLEPGFHIRVSLALNLIDAFILIRVVLTSFKGEPDAFENFGLPKCSLKINCLV